MQFIDGKTLCIASEGGTGSGANIMDFPNDAHRAVLQDFVDAIEQNREPAVSGQEGLETQQLIEKVLACAGRIDDLRWAS